MNNRGFVFTGIAFLMIIPSIILAASFVNIRRTGDDTITIKLYSDKVFYTYANIESNLNITGESLVSTYSCETTNISTYLTSTWRSFIIQNYGNTSGISITIPEDQINVSYDSATGIIKIGNINTSQGIPVNITFADTNIRIDKLLGPLEFSLTRVTPTSCTDADGDGYNASGGCNCGTVDCDDSDAAVYPGATEICDGKDNDCNSSTNENYINGSNITAPTSSCGNISVEAYYGLDCNNNSAATLYYWNSTNGWYLYGSMDDTMDRDSNNITEIVNLSQIGGYDNYTFNVTFTDADGYIGSTTFNTSQDTDYSDSCAAPVVTCPDQSNSEIVISCQTSSGCSNPNVKVNYSISVKDSSDDELDADSGGVSIYMDGVLDGTADLFSTGTYYYQSSSCYNKNNNLNGTAIISKTGCSDIQVEITDKPKNYGSC